MKITFDSDDFCGEVRVINIGGVVDILNNLGYFGNKPKDITAEVNCGCDLTVFHTDEFGKKDEQTFCPSLLCDILNVCHCFWAKDNKKRDVLVIIGL